MAIDKEIRIKLSAEENVSEAAVKISKNLDKILGKSLTNTENMYARVEAATGVYIKQLKQQNKNVEISARMMENFGDAFEEVEDAQGKNIASVKKWEFSLKRSTIATAALVFAMRDSAVGIIAQNEARKLMIRSVNKTTSALAPMSAALASAKDNVLKMTVSSKAAFSELIKGEGAVRKLKEVLLVASERGLQVFNKGLLLIKSNIASATIPLRGLALNIKSAFSIASQKGLEFFNKGLELIRNNAANASKVLSNVALNIKSAFSIASQKGLEAFHKGLLLMKDRLADTKTAINLVGGGVASIGKKVGTTGEAFVAAAGHTELFHKGLAGTALRAQVGASAISLLGASLLDSDSIFAKMTGVTLVAFALALGGIAVVIHQVLNAVGNLAMAIGNTLVDASVKQIEAFSKAEKTTFAFNQTITSYSDNAEEAAESTKNWTAFQEELTASTGTTAATMRAMIAETISATHSSKLNEEQMQQLITSTINLSERAHKPAIESLEAMIGAMNGNNQAILKLGLHMDAASVSHSKLSQAQKDNFETADSATKAQTRFAVLMEKAGRAAGFATSNADLYSKSLKLQENALKTLNAELGRGAALVNGQVVAGLASATNALTSFFKPILPGVGFLEALGGQVLKVGGFLTKNILTITLLTSSYKAFNVLLAKGFGSGFFGIQIPLIKKSLGGIAKSLGATTTKFNSLKNIGKASLEVVGQQSANAVKTIIGLDASAKLTAKTMGGQLVKGLKWVGRGILLVTKASLAFIASPLGLTIMAVAAAAFLLYKAFQKLEEETGIFTEIWNDLTESFAGTSAILEPVYAIFKAIGVVLSKVLGAAIKIVAASLSNMVRDVFRVILAFQKLSTFLPGTMGASAEAIAKTEASIKKLNEASVKLVKGAIGDIGSIFIANAAASDKMAASTAKWKKELEAASKTVSKFGEHAKKAFEFASDFTPKINFRKFNQEANKFQGELEHLHEALEKKQLVLLNAPEQTAEVQKALTDITQKIADSEEAIHGIKIGKAQETRDFKLNMVANELEAQREKIFTVDQEINEMRLQSYQDNLNAQLDMALSSEKRKQLEVASIRASLVQGTSSAAGANKDVEALNEEDKIARLNLLREKGKLSEEKFQQDKTAIMMAGKQKRLELEMALEQERITALGLSPEALALKLQVQIAADALELENLNIKYAAILNSDAEHKIAKEELEIASQERLAQIKNGHLEQEMARDQQRGDSFAASMKSVELSQRKHGMIMGTLRGVAATNEAKTLGGALSNLSALRGSESKKEFEIGKKAAIAQNVVSTFMAATLAFSSLAGIPIVGPVLGAAAAAAAIASGMMNLRKIKSQKFQGGGASGGKSVAAPSAGGQADQGIDAVPRSLSGKSFILSAGERVVQPQANKDLTSFLKDGAGKNESNFSIAINADRDSNIEGIKQAVMEGIREASERGEPIINSKGVMNG